VDSLLQNLKNLGPVKLAAMAVALVVVVGFFGIMMSRMSGQELQVLYAELDVQDANQIVGQLQLMNIAFEVVDDGKTIKVAPTDVGKARIKMAEAGLPRAGNVGYEIFDKEQAFGTSNFVQNISRVRALEGELSRTIASIDIVRNARVHLVLPERELFSRDKQDPSASIFLQLASGARLSKTQILAIQHLVSSAVPGLSVNGVSIIDDKGNLIARGQENSEDTLAVETAEEARVAYELRAKNQIEGMLENIVGFGKARATVSAELNFDKTTKNSESFDPESQVARSVQTVDEAETSSEKENNVSVQNNLPEAAPGAGAKSDNVRNSKRTEETTNFEISRVVTNEVRQTGTVKRLSVAVLIDGIYAEDKDGKPAYTPRTEDQISQIETLVKSAIGYDANRGDTVEIVNMQFAALTDGSEDIKLGFWDKLDFSQYVRLGETLVMALVGLLVVLLVVRPLMQRLLETTPGAAGAEGSEAMLVASGVFPALEGPDGSTLPALMHSVDGEEMMALDRIDGQIRASSMRKISEIVEKHPEETLQIIRNWLYEEA
jgi:flagellar M-ring protein FliF